MSLDIVGCVGRTFSASNEIFSDVVLGPLDEVGLKANVHSPFVTNGKAEVVKYNFCPGRVSPGFS
jgi:hypothetical protein